MANTSIQLKKSIISGNIPSSLLPGELAINTADGILFYKDSSDVIRQIKTGTSGNTFSTLNVNSSLLIAASNNDILTIDSSNSITISTDVFYNKITIGVRESSTSQRGTVQLYDNIDSPSSTLAATANAVYTAYNLANLAFNSSGSGPTTTNLTYQEFTSSNNQTIFSITNGYSIGKIKVFVNGVLLSSSDYTATNGTSIILSVPAWLNDQVVVEKWYNDVGLSNTYNLFYGSLDSNNITTSTNSANQVLDLFSTDLYRSVKYQIQVTSSTDYQVSEILVIHNGTTSYLTEYGLITTNGLLMNYDTDVNSGSVRLLMSPINNINTVKLLKTSIVV